MKKSDIKRWSAWLAFVLIFTIACVALSNWQFNRRAEAVAKIQQVEQNYTQSPVLVSELASIDSFDLANEWRAVSLSGHYLPELAVLVRNRPLNGVPGFLQLIPFQLDDGKIVAVITGWIPTGNEQDSPDEIPLPTAEPTALVGNIRAEEPGLGRDAPEAQIATINIAALKSKHDLPSAIYSKIYVRAQTSYSSSELPKILGKPQLTEGNHLSYALQWILFALMAFAALYWAIRKELDAQRLVKNPNFVRRKNSSKKQTDAEIEDSILGKRN